MLKQRQGFIEKGENILKPTSADYKKVILVNNTNSQVTNSYDAKVIDHVKIGDIIDIKIPVYRDGIEKYENLKVEVGAIMKESYAAGQDGNTQVDGAQVIFREDDYKELTGQKEYNKLFVTAKKGQLYPVEKRLEKLTKDYGSTEINGKGEELKIMGGTTKFRRKAFCNISNSDFINTFIKYYFHYEKQYYCKKKRVGNFKSNWNEYKKY